MPKTVETRVGVCYNDFKYCTKGETGMLISLVVPCYNEEESLPIFYKEASKIAQQMGISHGADFEFIFVDDGSKDRTLQIARELHRKDARVRYISSYYKRVVFIDRSPAVCYTVWDAVDW